ncbi:unnamed protein product, partial [marine sediment metagenome]
RGAKVVYEESLSIRRHLVDLDKSNSHWAQNVSLSLRKINALEREEKHHSAAATTLENSIAVDSQSVTGDETSSQSKDGLSRRCQTN